LGLKTHPSSNIGSRAKERLLECCGRSALLGGALLEDEEGISADFADERRRFERTERSGDLKPSMEFDDGGALSEAEAFDDEFRGVTVDDEDSDAFEFDAERWMEVVGFGAVAGAIRGRLVAGVGVA
jgi:hypothetical protein